MDNYDRIKDSVYFRRLGWAQLNNRWAPAVIATCIYSIVNTFIISTLNKSYFSLLIVFFILPVYYSYNIAFLNNKRDNTEIKIKSLFDGYKDFVRITLTIVLSYLYTFCGHCFI